MRFGKITPLLIGVLLLALLCNCICGGGNQSADMMKKVPVGSTSYVYWAIGRLAGDDDLLELDENIYGKFIESTEAKQLKDIGVVIASVEHTAKASGFDQGAVTVIVGSFNTKDIERSLEVEEYQKTTTSWDVVIWTPQNGQGYESVALLNNAIFIGSVDNLKDCIGTIIDEEEESLYEDSRIKAVADKLPDGMIIDIREADSEEKYDELIAYGKSYNKESAGETVKLKLTAIYMFQENLSAEQAKDEINNYLGNKAFTEITVEREENYIRATALISVDEFVKSLVF